MTVDIAEKLDAFFADSGISLWGVADLAVLKDGFSRIGRRYARAVSFAVPMDREIMFSIENGPNAAYAREYARINDRINDLSEQLEGLLTRAGHPSRAIAASVRSDPENIRGDFPHKTAATLAGIGFVGKNCQLVTRPFGPWVRLGTVLTDAPLAPASPVSRNFCGKCTRCMEACPAGALKGGRWFPGIARDEILDAAACDQWKKTHFFEFHKGHNCGICSSACPFGRKPPKKRPIEAK